MVAGESACPRRAALAEERVLENPRTVENPAQTVGEKAGLETRRRRRRLPHMQRNTLLLFITIRGPQAHPDRFEDHAYSIADLQQDLRGQGLIRK